MYVCFVYAVYLYMYLSIYMHICIYSHVDTHCVHSSSNIRSSSSGSSSSGGGGIRSTVTTTTTTHNNNHKHNHTSRVLYNGDAVSPFYGTLLVRFLSFLLFVVAVDMLMSIYDMLMSSYI